MKHKKREPSGKCRQPKTVVMIFMTQSVKSTFWGEIRRDWNCGKNELRRLPPTSVGEADLGGRLALLGPVGLCVYAQHPWSGMCQGSTGRMASSFSS